MKNRENYFLVIGSSAILVLLYCMLPSFIADLILNRFALSRVYVLLFSSLPSFIIGSIFVSVLLRKSRVNSNSFIDERNKISDEETNPSFCSEKEMLESIKSRTIQEMHEKEEYILKTIHEYVIHTITPYINEDSVELFFDNILQYNIGETNKIQPIYTNGKLTTLDIRHLAWNIGERLKWSGTDRSKFIKQCFPKELDGWEVETIRRTLRQKGHCTIKLDIPLSDNAKFNTINAVYAS